VTFDVFLAPGDARRVERVLAKLARQGLRDFALTGGLAIEAQLAARGCIPQVRILGDVDLVVESFDAIPPALAEGFLFRHIYPHAPQGKTLVQLVDPGEALRVDIFGACGTALAGASLMDFPTGPLAVVAVEDLAAREASLLMDLARGSPAPRKHAQDFERLLAAVDPGRIDAAARIAELMRARPDLLVAPEYSHDAESVCLKCEEAGTFRLAPPRQILAILGYC
jgi:hypothetical protein